MLKDINSGEEIKEDMRNLLIFYAFAIQSLVDHVKCFTKLSDKTSWCMEKTRVILFARQLFLRQDKERILNYLEDPCHTMLVFVSNTRKLVQWKGSLNEMSYETQNLLNGPEIVDSIQSLQSGNEEEKMKQIFLFYQNWDIQMSEMVLKELETLDSKPNWDVIILCRVVPPFFCPITQNIPINRIIPIDSDDALPLNNIRDIVKNPDFDQFEYLKYIQVENRSRFDCLSNNTTIHLGFDFISLGLLENIALLVENASQLTSTKIIFYRTKDRFWDRFMERNGLLNSQIFVL